MSTDTITVDEVFNHDELRKLGNPESMEELPPAQIVDWKDLNTVLSSAPVIADHVDRLKGRVNTEDQLAWLRGFKNEFGNVLYGSDEILEHVREGPGFVKMSGIEQVYPIELQDHREAIDTLEKYEGTHTEGLVEDFLQDVEENHLVFPALWEWEGPYSSVDAAFIDSETEFVASTEYDPKWMPEMAQQEETRVDVIPPEIDKPGYVQIDLPSDYGEVDYRFEDGYLRVQIDDMTQEIGEYGNLVDEVVESNVNNGTYELRLD